MKAVVSALVVLGICMGQAGCGGSGESAMTPEQLHESCLAVFERQGGPKEMGKQMCDSMRAACENDPSGEECMKAHRMVEKG